MLDLSYVLRVLRILRRLPEHAQLPIVHVSAHINHVGPVGVGYEAAAAAQRQPNAVSMPKFNRRA